MTKSHNQTTALALFSGGLDSTLACRVVAQQGIKVIAVKFITPFFGYDLLFRQNDYIRHIKDKFSIDVILKDITAPYLKLLQNPAHGFGRYFNPCIDCKIFLLSEARKMMPEVGASFLVTGEVIGQRPMSQRRDTLQVIQRESSCKGILVRPLCARNLEPTQAERNGLIDREHLLAFSGRDRKPQMELAEKYGITDYPSPAGGCILADPVLSVRIKEHYIKHEYILLQDILLLLTGRQFKLPTGGWLVLGRNQQENEKIETLRQPGDCLLQTSTIPGPTAILRYSRNMAEVETAAALVARFSKKSALVDGTALVTAEYRGTSREIEAHALEDAIFQPWQKK
jgi:tRNA U34 2-thiouridine synthase MnmA/TrmU